MQRKLATTLVLVAALVMSTFSVFYSPRPAQAAPNDKDFPGPHWPIDGYPPRETDNAILKWDEELLQTIRQYPPQTGPTISSRALGVLHTATYDAWAAYDARAVPVMKNGNPRVTVTDPVEREANKIKAISWAAYRVLRDLFPTTQFPDIDDKIDYDGQMAELLGDAWAADTSQAKQIGEQAAAAVLAHRHRDGANQLGDEQGSKVPGRPYVDYTNYTPAPAGTPWRWQPLQVPLGTGTVQTAATPQWKNVKLFALNGPWQFVPPGPPKLASGEYDPADIDLALKDTSSLTDTKKVMAEYWADGPKSEFPPGHWAVIAQALSRNRGHSLDTDAKMFMVLGNAVLDAGVSAWAAKYQWDFWRPITAIRTRYAGKMVNSWLGPYKGYGQVKGENWLPYQAPNVVTPPFPEYTSGHSTFSGAARVAILAFTGNDSFNAQVTIPAGSSLFEPRTSTQVGTPAKNVVLRWKDLLEASEQAGMSRRYGGIHFYSGDKHGRANGNSIGYWVYDKATKYFSGDTSIQVLPS